MRRAAAELLSWTALACPGVANLQHVCHKHVQHADRRGESSGRWDRKQIGQEAESRAGKRVPDQSGTPRGFGANLGHTCQKKVGSYWPS